ncbi:MAG: hypothetical protein LBV71_07175 [Prevotella sp.]|nr:hypothetical protein [Prevotella sp.]
MVFSAADGYIYAVSIESGRVGWKYQIGVPVFSSVAVSGNSFFVTDFEVVYTLFQQIIKKISETLSSELFNQMNKISTISDV